VGFRDSLGSGLTVASLGAGAPSSSETVNTWAQALQRTRLPIASAGAFIAFRQFGQLRLNADMTYPRCRTARASWTVFDEHAAGMMLSYDRIF